MGSNMSRVVLAGEKVLHSIPTPTMATRGFLSAQPHTAASDTAANNTLDKYFMILMLISGYFFASLSSLALKVFFINEMMVMGPTPPGTGVM